MQHRPWTSPAGSFDSGLEPLRGRSLRSPPENRGRRPCIGSGFPPVVRLPPSLPFGRSCHGGSVAGLRSRSAGSAARLEKPAISTYSPRVVGRQRRHGHPPPVEWPESTWRRFWRRSGHRRDGTSRTRSPSCKPATGTARPLRCSLRSSRRRRPRQLSPSPAVGRDGLSGDSSPTSTIPSTMIAGSTGCEFIRRSCGIRWNYSPPRRRRRKSLPAFVRFADCRHGWARSPTMRPLPSDSGSGRGGKWTIAPVGHSSTRADGSRPRRSGSVVTASAGGLPRVVKRSLSNSSESSEGRWHDCCTSETTAADEASRSVGTVDLAAAVAPRRGRMAGRPAATRHRHGPRPLPADRCWESSVGSVTTRDGLGARRRVLDGLLRSPWRAVRWD